MHRFFRRPTWAAAALVAADDVAHYAARVLDDPRAADALALLGIRNVVLQRSLVMATGVAPRVTSRRLTEIGRPGLDVAYAIDGDPGPATTDRARSPWS